MQLLNNQLMKLVLLVVVAAAVLVGLNLNQKKLGRNNTLLGSAAVVVVGGYLGYMLMEQKVEEPEEENTLPAPADNAVEVNEVVEGFENQESAPEAPAEPAADEEPTENDKEPTGNDGAPLEAPVDESENRNECLPRDVCDAADLLPKAYALNKWDTPAAPGGIDGPNFINPENLVGINTVGQSLRNANRQLRSEPPNPQVKVSPWLQTTIEPDTNRKPLEIGENCA